MANNLFTTIAEGVEEGKTLPVIVKDKDGKINSKKTNQININNAIFNAAQQNQGFSLGRLANIIGKFSGESNEQRVIRAAEKATQLKTKMAKGGMKKKQNGHTDYRKSGMFYVGGMSAKTTPINKGKK